MAGRDLKGGGIGGGGGQRTWPCSLGVVITIKAIQAASDALKCEWNVSGWMGKRQSCEIPSKRGRNASISGNDVREAAGVIQRKS